MDFKQSVKEKLERKEITGIKLSDGRELRLFISSDATGNELCYYPKGMRRRGYPVSDSDLADFKSYVEVKKEYLTENQKTYTTLFKYLENAKKATFTNAYIRRCLAIPASFTEWMAEGKKSIYDLGITTGNKLDGKVITLVSVQKEVPYIVEAFLSAHYGGFQYSSGVFPFRGYDGRLEVSINEEGEALGHLAMEFKNRGNGYYYLFINDFKFIGYDVD